MGTIRQRVPESGRTRLYTQDETSRALMTTTRSKCEAREPVEQTSR